MSVPEELLYVPVIGNVGLNLYQHAYISQIGKLEDVIKITSDKFPDPYLKDLIAVCDIFL